MSNNTSPACAPIALSQIRAALVDAYVTIYQQQAIENALSLALYHVRNGDTIQTLHTAAIKALHAASMLKQACTESTIGGRA